MLPRREAWLEGNPEFFLVAGKSLINGLRSVLGFVGIMLNISRGWSL
jgi:hypothetical protein